MTEFTICSPCAKPGHAPWPSRRNRHFPLPSLALRHHDRKCPRPSFLASASFNAANAGIPRQRRGRPGRAVGPGSLHFLVGPAEWIRWITPTVVSCPGSTDGHRPAAEGNRTPVRHRSARRLVLGVRPAAPPGARTAAQPGRGGRHPGRPERSALPRVRPQAEPAPGEHRLPRRRWWTPCTTP